MTDLTIWHFLLALCAPPAAAGYAWTLNKLDARRSPGEVALDAAHRAALTAAADDRTHGLGTAASAGGEPAPVPAPPGAAIAAGETSPNSPATHTALVDMPTVAA